jgi:hypothetical protein
LFVRFYSLYIAYDSPEGKRNLGLDNTFWGFDCMILL